MKKGRAGTMTHDYIRNGTTTLFAALNVLDGSVIGQCLARHRQQEFIRFLNRVETAVSAGKFIHAILDNSSSTSILEYEPGSAAIRAGPLISPRPRAPWPMRSRLFRRPDPAEIAARRLPLARRPAGRDQPLSRRAQPQTQTLCLDRRSRSHYRKGQPRAPSDRVTPLAG